MENLAGQENCDRVIFSELTKARVNVVEGEKSTGEVPFKLTGELNGFTFRRAWYYYVVSGDMPLRVAYELYKDPIGVSDVRVDGHCMCPPPGPPHHALYLDANDYQLVAPNPKNDEAVDYWRKDNTHFHRTMIATYDAKYRHVNHPEAIATLAIVDLYHIDSLAGLRLFADTIRKHDLHSDYTARNARIEERERIARLAVGPKPTEEESAQV